MVLANFVRGLADEEIKSKVFALQEEDWTPEKVSRFVEAEELGRISVLDIKPAGEAQQISGYMRSKMDGIPPLTPTYVRQCVRGCHRRHSQTVKCPEGYCVEPPVQKQDDTQQTQRQIPYCRFCNRSGHITAKCRLHSSNNDKQVKNAA